MFQSLSDLVQYFESSGNPTATNGIPGSTASGLYGFTTPTWQFYGAQAGIDLSAYPNAASAPADVQNTVFGQAVSSKGLSDWTCDRCDPALTNYLANNPYTSGLPVFGDSTTPVSSPASDTSGPSGLFGNGQGWFGTNWGHTPGAAPGSALPGGGAPGSLGTAASGWLTQAEQWLASIATRVGLFALALIFIIGALILFGLRGGK